MTETDKIGDEEDDVFAEDVNNTAAAEKETKDENKNLLNIKTGVRQCRSLSPQPTSQYLGPRYLLHHLNFNVFPSRKQRFCNS